VVDAWLDEQIALAVIDSPGPWPARWVSSDAAFVPLDVDTYDRFAMVLCFGDDDLVTHKVVGFGVFEDTGAGRWRRVFGGAGGRDGMDLLDRQRLEGDDRQRLHLRQHDSWESQARSQQVVFLCGPDVATVEIRRQRGTRVAEVSEGPGWLGVLWTPDTPPEVVAFAADGAQTFHWTPPGRAT